MPSLFDFVPMVLSQQGIFQTLDRSPEPKGPDNVAEYDRVMTTKLALSYAAGVEIIYRVRDEPGGSAVDLACGPGHYTLCLAKHLGIAPVTGVDIERPRVEAATRNAVAMCLDQSVRFQVGDISKRLDAFRDGELDLASFTGAAHHMDDLETVAGIVREMDRITKPGGLVMLMDLARLRTAKLTERYVNTLGQDYKDRGLGDFFNEFRNSMYAVWTPKELRGVIPTDSARWWCQLVPRGLPTIQIILGLPIGRNRVYLRRGFAAEQNPLIRDWYPRWREEVSATWADQTLNEWKLARLTLMTAQKHYVAPGK
jgi:ubiquinone/menaquinone biosynthesis C-methylase UbiE